MANMEQDLRARELELEYRSFLDDDATEGIYRARVEDMISKEKTRLIVKINDLRKNPNFALRAKSLIENSKEEIVAFQRALKEFVTTIDPVYSRKHFEFHVGLCGSFGSRHVTPRTLTTRFLNNTVCVEGIVSKVSLVKPKLLKAVYYCPATQKTIERRHFDLSSLDYQPTPNAKETKDEDGNPVEMEVGLSVYKDHQVITLQEMPEVAPPSQMPRCVDIVVDYDLVDSCKPGDRIQVVGTFRNLPNKQGNFTNCCFRTVVIANYVELLSKEVTMTLTEEDIRACKRLSKTRQFNIVDRLAMSLAPSIHGHENVKRALLCLLLGGVEKTLINGTRLRGDINILLIGDPSVAKSQLLRFVLNCAPRAIPTTGRGSSGVGLTAAVTQDPETGDRRLEAGAMVLADRGVVCIDEFDKMSDIDRTAMHEVMEQGRVSICKAGIQAKLNARCSVLAAANPVWGYYDRYKLPMDNIGMQDSLLSRFDLLFIMLDEHDREVDKKIATHVVRIHRYRPQGELDGEPTVINTNANYLTTANEENDENEGTEIFERHNPLLHGDRISNKDRHFSVDFLRKYIHIAKRVKPQLTEEACLMLGVHFKELRTIDQTVPDVAKTQPITARTLETLIRLSTAHAKARLSTKVESEDAAAAINLIQNSVYEKVLCKPKVKGKKRQRETGDENDVSELDETSQGPDGGLVTPMDAEASRADDDENEDAPTKKRRVEEITGEIRAKLPWFQEFLATLAREKHGASVLDVDFVYEQVDRRASNEATKSEIDALLELMSQNESVVIDRNCIYFL